MFVDFIYLDPSHQQRIPDLDGGEGSSEFIIHGTNVDISDPPAEAEQEERAETEREETPKEEMKKDGETVEEGDKDETKLEKERERESGTGQQPVEGDETSGGEIASEKKSETELEKERESGTGQQLVEGEETSGSGGEIGGEKKSEKDAATPDRSAIVTS